MANYTEENYDPSKHGYWKGTSDGANYGYPTNYFYADTIRSIMIAFGNFFNDMHVVRRNKFQEPVKIIDVPLKYGPRQKSHDMRTEQESGDTYYISLPNMTYKIDGINYAGERDSGIYETRSFYTDMLSKAGIEYKLEDQFWADVQPAPCNINISMEINCEKIDDLNQLIEQILPRFRPAAFLAVKEFWFFNKRRSIKLKLNDPGIQIENDSMGEEDKRSVKGTLSFTVEAVTYLPIKSAQIIQKIDTFITMQGTAGALWHAQSFGNFNGTLSDPHDMSKIYGTKVTNSYVLNGTPETTYDAQTSAYTTIYDYVQSNELTTYDKDAKLLSKMVKRYVPASKRETKVEDVYYDFEYRISKTEIPVPMQPGDPYYFWDQDTKMYHYDGRTYSGEPMYAWNEDTKSYDITGYSALPGEWLITKEYTWLSGWGENDDMSITYGHKTLVDEDEKPYSAYYSTYSEEGTVSSMNYKFDTKTTELSFSGKYDQRGQK